MSVNNALNDFMPRLKLLSHLRWDGMPNQHEWKLHTLQTWVLVAIIRRELFFIFLLFGIMAFLSTKFDPSLSEALTSTAARFTLFDCHYREVMPRPLAICVTYEQNLSCLRSADEINVICLAAVRARFD